MTYFVTGATGFIGRYLIERLLKKNQPIYALVRESSISKLDALRQQLGADETQLITVTGDLTQPHLGLDDATRSQLRDKIQHLYHLAAIYDLKADADSQYEANVSGTKHVIDLSNDINIGCFHHCSSIAAAGLYEGVFREDMFEEAEHLEHPYFRTKHDSEALVRRDCKGPWRVYRPAMVVGDSNTGFIDKIDGPYYFFKVIQRLRQAIPQWVPTVGIEGGRINIVPVDYVADAMLHLSHLADQDGKCFHLCDSKPYKIGEVLNIFAHAAHAPEMGMRIDTRAFAFIPGYIKKGLGSLPPIKRIINHILNDLGIPKSALQFINYPTRFDTRDTQALLADTGIKVPDLASYADKLWDYWERNLDPELFIDRSLSGRVQGKTIVVTGASSGIGKATALKLAAAGGNVILIARKEEALKETLAEIEAAGGQAQYYTADIASLDSCDQLVKTLLDEHGGVDILVNNAGRSIRRSIMASLDRFHDFERCMQLNYFGALRLITGLLPSMVERRSGHVINISSIGVLTSSPRFSAYVASKSALDAFTRCAASEFSDVGVHFTTINMPLVRTPMIGPTKLYDHVPTLTPEEAAGMVGDAIIHRQKRIATRLGIFGQTIQALSPKLHEFVMNTAFKMFPDSSASQGVRGRKDSVSSEQMAFAYLMKGVYW